VAGAIAAVPIHGGDQDGGTAVEMFVSPNLDRYLRRAEDCLGREDYARAIKVLQDVIEGRTLEVPDTGGGAVKPDAPKPDPPLERSPDRSGGRVDRRTAARPDADLAARRQAQAALADPVNCVFSPNGRIYRPVRRLCHELLASLPPAGLDIY